jgi:hypothetical protein
VAVSDTFMNVRICVLLTLFCFLRPAAHYENVAAELERGSGGFWQFGQRLFRIADSSISRFCD